MTGTRARLAVVVAGLMCVSGTQLAGASAGAEGRAEFVKGGTLYYADGVRLVEHWDPQRTYVGRDIANESRLFVRTLVQFGSGAGPSSNTLHPDLATDLGRSSDHARTWRFTLKSGVRWQDGSPVTCADVKYGVSRTFAVDVLTGGPNYAIQYLKIPTKQGGASAYRGPYSAVGQHYFDRAVTCSGRTIAFHLKQPVPDFNFATTLPAFAPFKKSQDHGAKSNFRIFSDGPYRLQGSWTEGRGGTFVRNAQYTPGTDDPSIRRALPDRIVFTEGQDPETLYDRLLADSGRDRYLVTDRIAPPDAMSRVRNQGSRYTDGTSPFDDFVDPNFTRIKNKYVRRGLAIATNRTAYIAAEGGPVSAAPAHGLVLPTLGRAGGYKNFRAFHVPDTGAPIRAKRLMRAHHVHLPYRLRFVYLDGYQIADAQARALARTWRKAGFHVVLKGLINTYFATVQNPANASKYEVTLGGWGADWPSASTVIPPLFDSRVNLSRSSNGQDYGLFSSRTINAAIDRAQNTVNAASRNRQWGDLDESLAKRVAYIPLDNPRFPRLHGSRVTHYVESASTSGDPDLGQIGAA